MFAPCRVRYGPLPAEHWIISFASERSVIWATKPVQMRFSARAKRSPDAVRFYSLRDSSIADLSNTEARTQCDDHRSLGYADIHDHQSPLIQPCSSAIPCCLPEPYSPAASNRNPGATSLTFAHQHQYRTRTNRERVPDPQAISTSAVSAVSASVRVSCQYHHGEVRPSP